MRKILSRDQRQDAEGQSEENGENLEGDELRERFLDVASVAKADSKELDRQPAERSNELQ